MNLTLTSHPCRNTIRHQTPPKYKTLTSQPRTNNNNHLNSPEPINQICSGFFGNCVDEVQVEGSLIMDMSQESKAAQASQKNVHQNMESRLAVRSSGRKNKISLSLKQSQLNFQTPKKQQLRIGGRKKKYSSYNKVRTLGCEQTFNESEGKKRQHLNHNGKMKTEPTVQQQGGLVNIHQMKESIKPSTHISSTYNNSARKTINENPQKVKLTISNNYKSQISNNYKSQISNEVNSKKQLKTQPLKLYFRKQESGGSQEVFEESLMTARLVNIYGEISNSSEANQTNSNIVYYNQIFNNEQIWRYKEFVPPIQTVPQQTQTVPQAQTTQQTRTVSPRNPTVLPNQVNHSEIYNHADQIQENKINKLKNTSILHEMDDKSSQMQIVSLNESSNQNKCYIMSKFKERKYIGEYAKTIKTFNNESEFISEKQSVVLQHVHFGDPFPFVSINRGSIKDYPYHNERDIPRRQYGSFGGIQHQDSSQQNTLRQYVSHPIYEGTFDQESRTD